MDCEIEQKYLDKIEHACGSPHPQLYSLCEVSGEARRRSEEFHRLSHEPERCEECHEPVWNKIGLNGLIVRPCPSRLCWEYRCAVCGYLNSSFGPLDCPTCGSLGRHPKVSAMRSLYRVKRKHW